jgi:hypothetical protein
MSWVSGIPVGLVMPRRLSAAHCQLPRQFGEVEPVVCARDIVPKTLVLFLTLIGSRALVVYVDVEGPSAANNRPWLRK